MPGLGGGKSPPKVMLATRSLSCLASPAPPVSSTEPSEGQVPSLVEPQEGFSKRRFTQEENERYKSEEMDGKEDRLPQTRQPGCWASGGGYPASARRGLSHSNCNPEQVPATPGRFSVSSQTC